MARRSAKFFVFVAAIFLFSASARAETFTAYLSSAQEVPANASTGTGYARIVVNEATGSLSFTVVFNGLSSNQTASHIHAPAVIGVNTGVAINFGAVGGTSGTVSGTTTITPTQLAQLRAHLGYVNVHTANFGGGEIRGQLGVSRPVDNDGDGRTDFSVLRFPNVAAPGSAPITFWNLNSTGGVYAVNFGDWNTDLEAPGDYDGDSKVDIAVYRDGSFTGDGQGRFFILRSSNNTAFVVGFGVTRDQPISRDFDGDGKVDPAIYRRGVAATDQAYWWIRRSTTNSDLVIPWGITGNSTVGTGDTPVPGDYDGDGKFDIAVYRFGGLSPNNTFIIRRSSDSTIVYQTWGNFTTDYILPGDYDGDGKTDYCAGRTGATPSTAMQWWILQSSNGQVRVQQFGVSSDFPTQGDYDGDARTDIAIFRRPTTSTSSTFWVFRSFDNTIQATNWGVGSNFQSDFPVNAFDAR